MKGDPEFCLICATRGRTAEFERLLGSLASQTYPHFHVVLVDQNDDPRLDPIVEGYASRLSIRHIRAHEGVRGASRGRNTGLALAFGAGPDSALPPASSPDTIIGFPDDDCWYPPDLLERVAAFFQTHPKTEGLTGSARDADDQPVGRWDKKAGPLTRSNVWTRGIAFALFLRAPTARRIGFFDEEIGPGSAGGFGAGEETDYLVRGIDLGARSFYDPALVVRHPNKKYTEIGLTRAFAYGAGMGYVLRRRAFKPMEIGWALVRPLLGAGLYLAAGNLYRSTYQFSSFRGRLWGYRNAGQSPPRGNPGGTMTLSGTMPSGATMTEATPWK